MYIVHIVHAADDWVLINFISIKYDYDIIYISSITCYVTRFHPVFSNQFHETL